LKEKYPLSTKENYEKNNENKEALRGKILSIKMTYLMLELLSQIQFIALDILIYLLVRAAK
jgi:hypothetical protein